MLPLVSIVLATYNGEKYIRQLLDSILKQDYPNIEIIVTDDHSSDTTFSILQEYASKYACIRIYSNENNLGINKNFEKGLLLARGEYVTISDQDDIWKEGKISILVKEIGNHTMIYHDSELIGPDGLSLNKKLSDLDIFTSFDNCLQFTIANRVPGHTMLFKKTLIAQCIPFPKNIFYDHWLAFVATFNTKIKFTNRVLVLYRQHKNNLSGAKVKSKKNRKKKDKTTENQLSKERIQLFYEKCPSTLIKEKKVLANLLNGYRNSTIGNNFQRMITYFRYNDTILSHKKYSKIRKWLFCLKTFVKMP